MSNDDIEMVARMLMFPPGCTQSQLPMGLIYDLLRIREVEGWEAMHRHIRQYRGDDRKKPEPQEIIIRIIVEQPK